jgi:hypothetical protein
MNIYYIHYMTMKFTKNSFRYLSLKVKVLSYMYCYLWLIFNSNRLNYIRLHNVSIVNHLLYFELNVLFLIKLLSYYLAIVSEIPIIFWTLHLTLSKIPKLLVGFSKMLRKNNKHLALNHKHITLDLKLASLGLIK